MVGLQSDGVAPIPIVFLAKALLIPTLATRRSLDSGSILTEHLTEQPSPPGISRCYTAAHTSYGMVFAVSLACCAVPAIRSYFWFATRPRDCDDLFLGGVCDLLFSLFLAHLFSTTLVVRSHIPVLRAQFAQELIFFSLHA